MSKFKRVCLSLLLGSLFSHASSADPIRAIYRLKTPTPSGFNLIVESESEAGQTDSDSIRVDVYLALEKDGKIVRRSESLDSNLYSRFFERGAKTGEPSAIQEYAADGKTFKRYVNRAGHTVLPGKKILCFAHTYDDEASAVLVDTEFGVREVEGTIAGERVNSKLALLPRLIDPQTSAATVLRLQDYRLDFEVGGKILSGNILVVQNRGERTETVPAPAIAGDFPHEGPDRTYSLGEEVTVIIGRPTPHGILPLYQLVGYKDGKKITFVDRVPGVLPKKPTSLDLGNLTLSANGTKTAKLTRTEGSRRSSRNSIYSFAETLADPMVPGGYILTKPRLVKDCESSL